jgi:hypothetical protein
MLSHFYLYITSHTNNLDVILTTAKTALRKRAVTFLRIEFADDGVCFVRLTIQIRKLTS